MRVFRMETNTGEFMLSARDRPENNSDPDLTAANSEMIYRVFYSKGMPNESIDF